MPSRLAPNAQSQLILASTRENSEIWGTPEVLPHGHERTMWWQNMGSTNKPPERAARRSQMHSTTSRQRMDIHAEV